MHKKDWFDDPAFWKKFYPMMFSPDSFAGAEKNVKDIIRLVKPKGKDLLDLCCGPGRYSIPFSKAGYRVTGVDKTKFLLNKARANARKQKAKIEWVHSDMRDFSRPGSFDIALNMYTSFGYFKKESDELKVLKNLYISLRRGGKLIMDMGGKEAIARRFDPVQHNIMPNGSRLFQLHEIIDNWTGLRNEWILISKGKVFSFKFDLTLYSGRELKGMLEKAGFADVKLFGNLQGDEYGGSPRARTASPPDARGGPPKGGGSRLIAVAEK